MFVLLFSASSIFATAIADNPLELLNLSKPNEEKIEKPSNIKQDSITQIMIEEDDDEEVIEFTPFIEKGKVPLPIAPEVVQSMAQQDVPESILENDEEEKRDIKVATTKEQNKELDISLADLFSDKTEEKTKPKNQDFSGKLAEAFSEKGFEGEILEGDGYLDITIAKKPGTNKTPEKKLEKDIKQTIESEVKKVAKQLADKGIKTEITQNKDGSLHVIKPPEPPLSTETKIVANSEPPTKQAPKSVGPVIETIPPLPALTKNYSVPATDPKKVDLPKAKKIVKIKKKKKIDQKLMRFVRDESIFILFKDDDIIEGKLSKRAEFEQMTGLKYLALYHENEKKLAGEKRAKQMEEFIEARSVYANVHLSDSYLKKAMKNEVRKSNLSNLRTLDDNYEIIDMVDDDGNTLLHLATYEDNPSIAKWLIMRGAHLSAVNTQSLTPMDIAGGKRNWQIFEMLERAGAE